MRNFFGLKKKAVDEENVEKNLSVDAVNVNIGEATDNLTPTNESRAEESIEGFVLDEKDPKEIFANVTSDSDDNSSVAAEFGEKIDSHIPDGGLQAWLQVVGSWCAIFMTFGLSTGTGVLMQWLSKNYLADISESQISWIFSIQLFLFYFLGVGLGPIVDAVGVRVIVIPGTIGWVAALFIMSACKKYYQFILCFSILGGISSACLFNPSVAVLTHWFSTKRGLALGIAVSGSGVGGIVFTQIFNNMLTTVGYGWAVRTVAFVVLASGVIACLTLNSRHTKRSINWIEAKPDIRALMEPSFFFCVFGLFFVEWGLFVPKQYIVPYAVMEGYSRDFGSDLVSYLSVASVVARVFAGLLSDRIGSFNLMVICAAITGIMSLAVWLPAGSTKGGLLAFAILFGGFSGACTSLSLITVPQLSNVKNAGRRYGTAYMIASFAVLTGIPIAGTLTGNGYLGMIIFAGCVYLAGSLCFLISRCLAAGKKRIF